MSFSKPYLLLLICIHCVFFAHAGNTLNAIAPQTISFSVLPNNGYNLQQILANKNLPFVPGDSLRPYRHGTYWLRIVINNANNLTSNYALRVFPSIVNRLYYFDREANRWLTSEAGLLINENIGRNRQQMALVLRPQMQDTVYVQMDVTALATFKLAIKPIIKIDTQAFIDWRQRILHDGWLIAVSVLAFFFLYNLYLDFSLMDLSVLYYLIIQAGAIIYITTTREFLQFFFPVKLFRITVLKDGFTDYYDLNYLLMHASILLVIYGFVALTRSYLNTKKHFPRTDKVLKFGLVTYILLSLVLMGVNTGLTLIEHYTLPYDNFYLLLLISVIMYVSVAAYRRRLKVAGPFLLANSIPLALMIGITIFHAFITVESNEDLWMPNLAIVSQAFCFSVALVARTRVIQQDLEAKKLEALRLTQELNEIELRHAMAVQEGKAKAELLQHELDANQRELASNTLYLVQKNELLATLRDQIAELERLFPGNVHNRLPGIESILQSNVQLDNDWSKFKLHFEKVHPDFFENLYAKHPTLTKNEVRLCAYFHMNLSGKEIATLLNIAPTSVRVAKARLLKKMGNFDFIDPEPDLGE